MDGAVGGVRRALLGRVGADAGAIAETLAEGKGMRVFMGNQASPGGPPPSTATKGETGFQSLLPATR